MSCLDKGMSNIHHMDVAHVIINIIMISCIVLGNIFIIYAVVSNWRRHGLSQDNTSSTLLAVNLSVADALVGLLSVYHILPEYMCAWAEHLKHHFTPCIFKISLIAMAHIASGFTLLAIGVDRYIAVVQPLRYKLLLRTRRTVIIIGGIWMLAVTGSSSIFWWNNWEDGKNCKDQDILTEVYLYGLYTIQLIILIVITMFYWHIHRVALGIHQRTKQMSIAQKILTKSARGLMITVAVYLISWTPHIILRIIEESGVYVPTRALHMSESFVDVSYVINPFIYAFNTRPVKIAISNTLNEFKMMKSIKSNSVTTTTTTCNL